MSCFTLLLVYFQPLVSRENVLRHVFRLLFFVHPHINLVTLLKLIDSVKPTGEVVNWCLLTFIISSQSVLWFNQGESFQADC